MDTSRKRKRPYYTKKGILVMKNILTVILIASMLVFGFTACSNGNGTAGNAGSQDSTPSETQNTAPSQTPEEIIEAIYAEKSVDLRLMTTPVDLESADSVQYNLGLKDASAIKEAAVSEPMMSSQAYSLVIARVNDAADAQDVAKAMLDGIDQRKWICVEADSLKVMTRGDLVLLFMVDSSFSDTVTTDEIETAFAAVCGGTPDLILEK